MIHVFVESTEVFSVFSTIHPSYEVQPRMVRMADNICLASGCNAILQMYGTTVSTQTIQIPGLMVANGT